MSGIQGTSGGPRSSAGANRAPDTREPVKNGLEKSISVQTPILSLPKGGGAISGIGEKFTANPVTGSASMTVPIAVSQVRQGMAPQLALSYDSGTGNSPFGFGWSLSLPTIARKTDKGLPRYEDAPESDVFLHSGTEDLVLAFARDDDGNFLVVDGAYKPFERSENLQIDDTLRSFVVRRYRPRIEGLFARIERWTRDDGDVHWRTITKDNVLTLYGLDEWSRIADPQNSRRICSWLISETRDDRGNAIVYSYKPEDATGVDRSRAHQANRYEKDKPLYTNRYPKRIQYGNRCSLLDAKGQRPPLLLPSQIAAADFMFEVVFDYGDHDTKAPKPHDDEEKHADGRLKFPWPERADPFSARRAGFEIRTARSVDACFCSITFLDSVRIASCARRISLTGTRGIMQTRAGQSIRF